ncbi:MAG: peptidoglycan DD-metalloendopeptidase family protein [Pseudomonadota bacterium]
MKTKFLMTTAVLALTGAMAACTPNKPASSAKVDIRGTNPNAALEQTGPNTLNNSVIAGADAKGIVTYDGYQTARARRGDTVGSVAERVGLSATQLGAYNGLPASHALRDGDELALPPRPGGYGASGTLVDVTAPASETRVASADPAPVPTAPSPASTIEQQPLGGTEVNEDGSLVPETATEQAAAQAPEAAPADPESAETAGPNEPGWSPDLAAAAIARSNRGINDDGSLGAPPSAGVPVPPEPTKRRELESPGLSQYQTEESGGATPVPPTETAPEANTELALANTPETPAAPQVKMRRPVDGPVAIGFNKGAGPARNDGVDFATPAGAKVVAALDGEVALVSQSLGGLGTIVLMRHPNELLTVYGRIDGVLVNKGDIVRAGQQIGIVSDAAAPAEPRMHFEVRRGSESLDPMQFL